MTSFAQVEPHWLFSAKNKVILRILSGLQACFWQLADIGNENYSFVGNAKGYKAVKIFVLSYFS